ncbi:MAG: ankyrin repeat domain-containing protein [Candidatus Eremiobacteraeota bacterium]|nr:ankyrin repeat domain-containing protein [Candidatus Eremiobacteraeota bacterium]
MAKTENDEYFKLLHSFRAASHQGRGPAFISEHPEILSIRSEGVQETILHYVAVENGLEGVRELAAAGAEIDCRDSYGTTPLLHSAQLGYRELVALLLELGADVTSRDMEDRTVLHYWTSKCDETILKLLVAAGADLHAEDDMGETPLGLLHSQDLREQRVGPPEQISVEGLIRMGFGEETIKNFRELQTKVDFSSMDRTRPDYVRGRELLIAAGADPENLGSGYIGG